MKLPRGRGAAANRQGWSSLGPWKCPADGPAPRRRRCIAARVLTRTPSGPRRPLLPSSGLRQSRASSRWTLPQRVRTASSLPRPLVRVGKSRRPGRLALLFQTSASIRKGPGSSIRGAGPWRTPPRRQRGRQARPSLQRWRPSPGSACRAASLPWRSGPALRRRPLFAARPAKCGSCDWQRLRSQRSETRRACVHSACSVYIPEPSPSMAKTWRSGQATAAPVGRGQTLADGAAGDVQPVMRRCTLGQRIGLAAACDGLVRDDCVLGHQRAKGSPNGIRRERAARQGRALQGGERKRDLRRAQLFAQRVERGGNVFMRLSQQMDFGVRRRQPAGTVRIGEEADRSFAPTRTTWRAPASRATACSTG